VSLIDLHYIVSSSDFFSFIITYFFVFVISNLIKYLPIFNAAIFKWVAEIAQSTNDLIDLAQVMIKGKQAGN